MKNYLSLGEVIIIHCYKQSIPSLVSFMYPIVSHGAWPLLRPWTLILNYVFVHCALESALWQRLSAIKVEFESELFGIPVKTCRLVHRVSPRLLPWHLLGFFRHVGTEIPGNSWARRVDRLCQGSGKSLSSSFLWTKKSK